MHLLDEQFSLGRSILLARGGTVLVLQHLYYLTIVVAYEKRRLDFHFIVNLGVSIAFSQTSCN